MSVLASIKAATEAFARKRWPNYQSDWFEDFWKGYEIGYEEGKRVTEQAVIARFKAQNITVKFSKEEPNA